MSEVTTQFNPDDFTNPSLWHFVDKDGYHGAKGEKIAFKGDDDDDGSVDDFCYELLREDWRNKDGLINVYHTATGLQVHQKEVEGGGEGGAEDCSTVVKIGEQFFRFCYSYRSHCGFEFDDVLEEVTEVFPNQVMVTVYTSNAQ